MTYVISLFWNKMKKKSIVVKLAEIQFEYSFVNRKVQIAFADFLTNTTGDSVELLTVSESDICEAAKYYENDSADEYIEFMELGKRTADALLKYRKCMFHGVAIVFRGKAYLFTAPSGTGKTTQYFLWKLLYENEISIINGDKPILDFAEEEGTIIVKPSPWKGKEGMGSMESAPLGGIIYLRQGKENAIRRLKPKEAIVPVLSQFICSGDTKEQIQMMCHLEEQLLRTVPVYLLTNCGDEASAKMCYDTILQEVREENEI